jgi:3-oxoacyl-[acyl-carrier-protein] synthase II
MIRNGEIDIAIAGGAEAPLHPAIFGGFCLARILTTNNDQVPQPFDQKRNGTVISEGAAILVLEELDSALRRNATIYTEITGYGSTCDSYHIVNPDPEGLQGARAISIALADANIKPEDIAYINAHGTGTVKNDQAEVEILKKAFGKCIYSIPVSSTKSITGHLLGASGAVEAVICALAIKNKIIPPTINYKNPDPQCDLDFVPDKSRNAELDNVLSNSFGFGGFNAALIFKKLGDENV